MSGMWTYRGQCRPAFARVPSDGEESVWDYPRPPAIVPDARRIEVWSGERRLAASSAAIRVLETASPPTFYLPPGDVDRSALLELPEQTSCEWKGAASYFCVAGNDGAAVAWVYAEPRPSFRPYAGWFCFYPSRVRCTVDDETVRAQAGDFYGGWITDEIVGPFKGDVGTGGW